MNQPPPPPLLVRLCPRHGLVAGPDGRCVICHRRDEGGRSTSSGPMIGLVAAVLVVAGGAFAWKATRAGARTPPDVVRSEAPAPVAPAPPVPEDDPAPTMAEERKEQRRVEEEQELQRSIEAEIPQVHVTMYRIPKCDMCDVARDWMKQKNVPFTEVDVSADPSALEAMHKLTPGDQVPVFDVEGEAVVGFGPTNVAGAIRRAADKRARARF